MTSTNILLRPITSLTTSLLSHAKYIPFSTSDAPQQQQLHEMHLPQHQIHSPLSQYNHDNSKFQPYLNISLCVIYGISIAFSISQLLFHLIFNRYTRIKCGFRHFARIGFSLSLMGRLGVIISTFFVQTHVAAPLWHLPNDLISLSFVFCHIFLIFYWVSCYAKIRLKGKLHKTRLKFYLRLACVFGVSGVFLYGTLVALHGVLFSVQPSSRFELYKWIVLCAFFPIVTFLLAILFCFFSLKTFSEMTRWISRQNREYKYLRRIGIVIALALVWLYFKQLAMVIIQIPEVATLFGLLHEHSGVLFFVFLAFGEALPTVLTLFMFMGTSPTGFERLEQQKHEDHVKKLYAAAGNEHDHLISHSRGRSKRMAEDESILSEDNNDPGLFI